MPPKKCQAPKTPPPAPAPNKRKRGRRLLSILDEPSSPGRLHREMLSIKFPTDVLTVLVFGGGENGELGLGPKRTEALRPQPNPYLDPSSSKLCIIQDRLRAALGRDSEWSGGKLRDADEDGDEDEDGVDDLELNPLESTPTAIPEESFPSDSLSARPWFVQVAPGDNCSFVLTDTGLVHGWGTFRDTNGNERFGSDGKGAVTIRQKSPTLIPDTAGNIWAWGCNEQNQFGPRFFSGRGDPDIYKPQQVRVCRGAAKYIGAGQYHCFAVDKKDNVWGWGLDSFGQVGDTKTVGDDSAILPYPVKIRGLCSRGVVQFDGSSYHSAAVAAAGECFVWGRMYVGQLGMGFMVDQLSDANLIHRNNRGSPRICLRPIFVPVIGEVASVACDGDHTIFVNRTGHVYTTLFGYQGRLGLGSEHDVSVATRIQGKHVKDRRITWTGADGGSSVVAGSFSVTT
ncbi:regulator of chromosome condensation [Xylariaceae sp. FL0255]|nr:regulator of chromosome condensation [Xylariaceae sp. FL0255]